jgi:D-alanine--poly(phosphoribitol) ligase subunit 2
MTATETTEKILDVLANVAETEEVRTNPELALYDLQILDSMKTVDLIVALGGELGVEISPAEFERENWATPRKLVADVLARLGTS